MALESLDIVSILENNLEREVKSLLVDKLVERYLNEFEAELRLKIEDELTCITFETIQKAKDLIEMREELRVLIFTEGGIKEENVI